MGLEAVKEALPAYAKDLKLNLGGLTNGSSLSDVQLWGAVVSAALASPQGIGAAELVEEGRARLDETAFEGAKAASSIMAMNNVYYRAKHLLADAGVQGYTEIPARLRMQVIATREGAEKSDFELWSLAVSAVNGCGACLAAHERVLRAEGVTAEQVHEALRVAAVVHAACVTMAAEQTLSGVVG